MDNIRDDYPDNYNHDGVNGLYFKYQGKGKRI